MTSQNDYLGFYLSNDDGKGSIATGQYLDSQTNYTLLSTYAFNGVEYEAGQSVALDAVIDGATITNHFKVNILSELSSA